MVRFFRVQKMYDNSKKRMIYSPGPAGQEARKHVLAALTKADWDIRTGKAPDGYMERELQQWLESLLS